MASTDELDVLQDMKKALIGNCPVCDCKHTVILSPMLEIPIGVLRQCHSCLTPLRVMPSRPRLKIVVDLGGYLGFLVWAVVGDQSVVTLFYAVTIYFFWSFIVTDFVGRRLWEPVLVVTESEPTTSEITETQQR
jgi:hypothetical protein